MDSNPYRHYPTTDEGFQYQLDKLGIKKTIEEYANDFLKTNRFEHDDPHLIISLCSYIGREYYDKKVDFPDDVLIVFSKNESRFFIKLFRELPKERKLFLLRTNPDIFAFQYIDIYDVFDDFIKTPESLKIIKHLSNSYHFQRFGINKIKEFIEFHPENPKAFYPIFLENRYLLEQNLDYLLEKGVCTVEDLPYGFIRTVELAKYIKDVKDKKVLQNLLGYYFSEKEAEEIVKINPLALKTLSRNLSEDIMVELATDEFDIYNKIIEKPENMLKCMQKFPKLSTFCFKPENITQRIADKMYQLSKTNLTKIPKAYQRFDWVIEYLRTFPFYWGGCAFLEDDMVFNILLEKLSEEDFYEYIEYLAKDGSMNRFGKNSTISILEKNKKCIVFFEDIEPYMTKYLIGKNYMYGKKIRPKYCHCEEYSD